MDTPTMTPPAAFQPKPLTEAEVHAWLRSKVEASGIKGLELKISSDSSASFVFATGFIADKYECEFGKTIIDAVESFRRHVKTPEAIAEQKRAQAAKLLAEADALTGEHRIVVTDETGAVQSRCTIAEFVRDNGIASTAEDIREAIRQDGQFTMDLGAGGTFTLRPEETATPAP